MGTHFHNSQVRGNAYSDSKFTNWRLYDPFFAEARSALKRFEDRLPTRPSFPRVISLPAFKPDFFHVCSCDQMKRRLHRMPAENLHGLRAIFLLAGTRKQQRCWSSSLYCYDMYWRSCVFLCAYLFDEARLQFIDELRAFYLDDVLVHEIAHHADRFRLIDPDTKEGFAHAFVQRQRAS